MKQKDNLWWFESHQEIRDYVRQDYPASVFLASRRCAIVRDGLVVCPKNHSRDDDNGEPVPEWIIKEGRLEEPYLRFGNMTVMGNIEDYPAEGFATKHNYDRYRFEAGTVLDAFYQAGDHLASLLKVDGATKGYTAMELAADPAKGGPVLTFPEQEKEILYTVTTPSCRYQSAAGCLFRMIDQMEKATDVGPSKRRRFTVRSADDAARKVVTRMRFTADKALPKLRKCWTGDELRPVMKYPALEIRTGTVVCSDGHVLAAHKLKDYGFDGSDVPMFKDVLLPREITSMKGAVTVEVEEKTVEHVIGERDGKPVVTKSDGLLVTAIDEKGRHGEVFQEARYPNWRSVFPVRVGKPVNVDVKGWSDGTKRIMPQLSEYSQMMRMDAARGAKAITLSGEDYDFSKEGSVSINVPGGVKYGMWVGVKAPQLINVLAFEPDVMYFTAPDRALVFGNADTMLICMPMLINDNPDTPRGPEGDKETMRLDINKWADGTVTPTPARPKAKKAACPKAGKFEKAVDKAVACEEKWEDRIRHYVAENYPTQAVVSAATDSPDGKREREAMKDDAVLKDMRSQADREWEAADRGITEALKEEPEPSVEDRLRAALRKQLAMAA